jgi:hypothetical protein
MHGQGGAEWVGWEECVGGVAVLWALSDPRPARASLLQSRHVLQRWVGTGITSPDPGAQPCSKAPRQLGCLLRLGTPDACVAPQLQRGISGGGGGGGEADGAAGAA